MRLFFAIYLLLAVLASIAHATSHPTADPTCDVHYGLGNKAAYVKIDNPYHLDVTIRVTYYPYANNTPATAKQPHNTTAPTITVNRPKVVTICGLSNGTVYIEQRLLQPGETLSLFNLPIAIPRNAVLQPGETTTITAIPATALTLAFTTSFYLILTVATRPRIKKVAVYTISVERKYDVVVSDILIIGFLFYYVIFFLCPYLYI